MNRITLFTILIIGLYSSLNAQILDINREKLIAKVDSLIPTPINDSTPGLVIGVLQKGKLVFSNGYGLANLTYNIPNDPKMLYNIGSVSKQFLGYAFAMLHVKGDLNLDYPISSYLENWPEFDHTVTLRHLLSHTSGYREAYTMSNLAGRNIGVDRLTREECLEVVRKQPQLEFIPGSRFTYNSTAWVILAEILEKVTEQPADEWVEKHILTPLGMKNTRIESYVGEVIPNAAESYTFDQNRGYRNSKSNRAIFGAADVFTSVDDLVLWINNLKTAKLGGKEVLDLFLTTFKLNNGLDSGYGLGIQNGLHRGLKLYSHNGGHSSFITQLRYYPEHEIGIISISNLGQIGAIPTNKIAEYIQENQMNPKVIRDDKPFDIDKKKLKQFEGTYINSLKNQTRQIGLVNDSLTIWGNSKLIPISPTTFRTIGWGGKFEIKTIDNEKIQLKIQGDSETIYEKVNSWIPSKKDLIEYEGKYWSEELETLYHINIQDKKLVIRHRWLGEIQLEPITNDLFRYRWGWYVELIRNKENKIEGLNINSSRTLNVYFERME
jgi:CubicO group peptidase (beta-lactamase class C family)